MDEEARIFRQKLLDGLSLRSSYFRLLRQHFHMYPERTTQEVDTAHYISSILSEHSITHTCNIAQEHGIVATIQGELSGPVIALRADMDALEIIEETGLPYASKVHGLMHACGHDFHMAAVLATGLLLNEHRNGLKGTVKLIFQPAEENGPRGGAKDMIAARILENPKVDAIFACHVFPSIPHGTLWIPSGPVMAAVDNYILEVKGRGGHAAMPDRTIDPIPIAAHLILALNCLVSKTIAPNDQAVISLGKISGGNRRNVIPDSVFLEGTMRTLSPSTRQHLKESIYQLTEHIPAVFGALGTVEWFESYSPTVNDARMAVLAKESIDELPGRPFSIESGVPQMTAEDFGSFLIDTPGAFILFGTGDGQSASLHSSRLTIDDKVLDEMVAMYVSIIASAMYKLLNK